MLEETDSKIYCKNNYFCGFTSKKYCTVRNTIQTTILADSHVWLKYCKLRATLNHAHYRIISEIIKEINNRSIVLQSSIRRLLYCKPETSLTVEKLLTKNNCYKS